MAGAQNKKNSPGAFRSCLIPYREQIFTWWYKEHKTARDVQKQIAEHFSVDVHWTTVARFIKVRRNKPDPHELPQNLATAYKTFQPLTCIQEAPKTDNTDAAEAEALLARLRNSTPQQLGIEAKRAMQKSKRR